jgi:hypothetical protein
MRPHSPSDTASESPNLTPLQITHITPADAMGKIIGIYRPQALPAVSTVQPAEGIAGDCATADRLSDAVHATSHHRSGLNTGGLFAPPAKAGHGAFAAVGRDAA